MKKTTNRAIRHLSIRAKGSLKFVSTSIGAFLALPLMFFNGLTTVVGAGKVLPLSIGYPVGLLWSSTYFLVVVIYGIRREYPLRRFLLVCILAIGSTYTSFFAIYNQMSDGNLEYQSVNTTVIAHNNFRNNISASLARERNKLEAENPKILELLSVRLEISNLRDERDRLEDQDSKGQLANQISNLQKRLENLSEIESDLDYQNHLKIRELTNNYSEYLSQNLSNEEFIVLGLTSSGLFAKDKSLHETISSNLNLSRTLWEKPKYDDYVQTPIFLVPFEIAFNIEHKRQFYFMIFAITVSVVLEIIPLLLAGINISYNPLRFQKSVLDNDRPLEVQPGSSTYHRRKFRYRKKTIINQISGILSSFVLGLKQTRVEILRSIKESVGMTNYVCQSVEKRLNMALSSISLEEDNKKEFLNRFYESIDKHNYSISIPRFKAHARNSQELENFVDNGATDNSLNKNKNEKQFLLLACLFIDIMSDSKVSWLSQKPFIFAKIGEKNDENSNVWYFTNNAKYQEFLDWWLREVSGDIDDDLNDDNQEVRAKTELWTSYENNDDVVD